MMRSPFCCNAEVHLVAMPLSFSWNLSVGEIRPKRV
jgi:hypothetical protein